MFAYLVAFQLAAVPAAPAAHNPVFHGRAGDIEISAPRLDASIVVDGTLDEAVWREAALLTGFSQYRPVDGLAAEDSTEVLLWYSSEALHIGIRAFEPHGSVNATLADRDAIFSDDYVQLLLDTFDDRRRALMFAVNPYGVQADGVRDESQQGGSGAFNAEAAEGGTLDLRPDFVFASRGRVTNDGYEIELRIPFKSMRFQPDERQSWGINVVRQVQHAGQTQTWTAVRRGETSFLNQSGRLLDLYALDRGLVVDIQPEITRALAGAPTGPEGAEEWDYTDDGTEIGLNARWGITPNLTLSAALNPDFSQIEGDAAVIQFDPRQAVGFPEQRPFFLESSENFDVGGGLIHTRTIVDPLGAVKLAGKIAGTDVGILSAVDDTSYSRTGREHPIINLLRVRRDLGDVSTLGVAWTDRIDGDDYNRVGSVDGKLVLGNHTLRMQAANAFTRSADGDFSGPLWYARIDRAGREWGWSAFIQGISPEYYPGSGFLSRNGVVHQAITPRLTFFPQNSRIESFSTAINFNNMWKYDRFTDGETRPDELKVHFNNSFRLRGGWNAGLSLLVENFLYPQELYTDYAVERTVEGVTDTIPFSGTPSINNYDIVLSIGTPEFQTFNANGFVLMGRDDNYPEWAPGWLVWAEGEAEWRPTERLRISPRYSETRVMRPDDWSVVTVTQIPRLRLEYQVSRPVFVRLVGQYVARRQDTLHDDSRTEAPILLSNGDGTYRPAIGFRANSLRLDGLFSYQPTPGTVIFAGYGTTLGRSAQMVDPSGPFDQDFERQTDGLFLKVSYLFRL
jgi:hypothetical protein